MSRGGEVGWRVGVGGEVFIKIGVMVQMKSWEDVSGDLV